MKLLLVSAAFPPIRAGESEHAFELCRQFAVRGIDVHVLTSQGARVDVDFSCVVHPRMATWSWREMPRLAAFVRSCAPDAVLLVYSDWLYHKHPMVTFLPTLTKRLAPQARFVAILETQEEPVPATLPARVMRKGVACLAGSRDVDYYLGTLLRDSDAVIIFSELHLSALSTRYPGIRQKGLVVPPPPLLCMVGTSAESARMRGRQELGVAEREFLLAFFGYADRNKGIETLFAALQILATRRGDVRLVMIGGGRGQAKTGETERARAANIYEERLRELPAQLGIADKVIWLPGYAPGGEEASRYLHAADVCVLPFDGGVTLNRSSVAAAAAHGLPIITTKRHNLETPFRHGDNVFLCPPKDPEALAVAFDTLIESPQLRRQLGDGALRMGQEWFSWENALQRTMDALGG